MYGHLIGALNQLMLLNLDDATNEKIYSVL